VIFIRIFAGAWKEQEKDASKQTGKPVDAAE
jgi:hypothetical protein